MIRKTSLDGLDAAPRWIVVFLGAYLMVDLFVLHIWNASGQAFSLQGTSGSGSALSVTGMAGVDLWLCLLVLRSFPSGAPLRPAWMLITLSAAARAASGVVAQFLGTDWLLNPLVWNGHARFGLVERSWLIAQMAGGPVRLVLLAVAMRAVLRTFRTDRRPGSALRHRLGHVRYRLPVHPVPVHRGRHGVARRAADRPRELDLARRDCLFCACCFCRRCCFAARWRAWGTGWPRGPGRPWYTPSF